MSIRNFLTRVYWIFVGISEDLIQFIFSSVEWNEYRRFPIFFPLGLGTRQTLHEV
jgi:hypothetical protein